MLTASHTFRSYVTMADQSIILPLLIREDEGRLLSAVSLPPIWMKWVRESRNFTYVQTFFRVIVFIIGELCVINRRRPLFLSPLLPSGHDSSPARTTSYTKSKIAAVYIRPSSALRSVIRLPLGCTQRRSHRTSTSYPRSSPRRNPCVS